MHIFRAKRFSIFMPFVTLLAVSGVLAACSTPGDFGRPRKSFFLDTVNDELTGVFEGDQYLVGDVNNDGRYKGRKFALTPDELDLRDIARHFNEPLAEDRYLPVPDTNKEVMRYAESLTKQYHYGPARMGVIASQIDADRKKVQQLEDISARVKQADQSREDVLSRPHPMLTNRDRIRAASRIEENDQVIHAIFRDLEGRLASYAYAIQRSHLETPGQIANDAEPALALLREKVATAQSRFDAITREYAMRKKAMAARHNMGDAYPMTYSTGSVRPGVKYYAPRQENNAQQTGSLVKQGSYHLPQQNNGQSSDQMQPLILRSKTGL